MVIELLKNNGVDVENAVKLLGGIEYYDQTLKEFYSEMNPTLLKIKTSKEQNDLVNYSILVQGLKSDSSYLGFTKLSKLAYEHELASKENNIKYVDEHFNELMIEAIKILNLIKLYNEKKVLKDTIIVADDSSIICNFINKIFKDKYEILPAMDGSEVIDIIESNKDKNIVGLLLDLNMPNVNGFSVLEYFEKNKLFENIPVSIITGDDTKDSIEKIFKYPIIDMLSKPFNVESVKRIVDRTVI